MSLLKATILTLGAFTFVLLSETAVTARAFYRTIDNRVEIDRKGHAIFKVESIEEASRSQASFPAEEDVEGHWSPVTRGFQLSLRFEGELHVTSEPVMATLLIRNTTSQTLYFDTINGNDAPFDFLIVNEQRKLLPPLQQRPELITGSIKRIDVAPGMQRRYKVRLDDKFPLNEKGTYAVTAKMRLSPAGLFGMASPDDVELVSENSLLQLASSLPPTPGQKKFRATTILNGDRIWPPPSQPAALPVFAFGSPEVEPSREFLAQPHSAVVAAVPPTPALVITENNSFLRPRDKFYGMILFGLLFATGIFLYRMRVGESCSHPAQTK